MPDKHEVGGSSPLGPTKPTKEVGKWNGKLYIENRIERKKSRRQKREIDKKISLSES